MNDSTANPITQLLAKANDGDETALRQLWLAIHDDLHAIARKKMAGEAPGHTLQPTALVHEAYFRLFGGKKGEWTNRRHFFAAAARAMRQILIDDARKRKRLKRGGGRQRSLEGDAQPVFEQDPAETLAIDEALEKLEQDEPRKAEVVMLRYFAGLKEAEIADVLGVARRTVQTDWRLARAWLHRELSKGDTTIRVKSL